MICSSETNSEMENHDFGHSTIATTERINAHFDGNDDIGSAGKLAVAFGEKDVEEPMPSGGEMK